jgi:hypothetical protein
MIQQFLLIIQREVLVHKWMNVEYLVEEYAGDVFMGDGDNDSVNDSLGLESPDRAQHTILLHSSGHWDAVCL